MAKAEHTDRLGAGTAITSMLDDDIYQQQLATATATAAILAAASITATRAAEAPSRQHLHRVISIIQRHTAVARDQLPALTHWFVQLV